MISQSVWIVDRSVEFVISAIVVGIVMGAFAATLDQPRPTVQDATSEGSGFDSINNFTSWKKKGVKVSMNFECTVCVCSE
jgi:hypothetical protein